MSESSLDSSFLVDFEFNDVLPMKLIDTFVVIGTWTTCVSVA